jgi:hypothetical protein
MGIIRFIKEYVGTPIYAVLGALWVIYGFISQAHDLWTAGLAPGDWQAIGAAVFFLSVGFMLYKHHRKVEALLPPPCARDSLEHPGPGPLIDAPNGTAPPSLFDQHETLVTQTTAPSPAAPTRPVDPPEVGPALAPEVEAFMKWLEDSAPQRQAFWAAVEVVYDQWREAQPVTLPKLTRQLHETTVAVSMKSIDGDFKEPLKEYFPPFLSHVYQTFCFAQFIYPEQQASPFPEIDAQRRDLVEQWNGWGISSYLGEGPNRFEIRNYLFDCRDELKLLAYLEFARYLQVGFKGKPKAGLLYFAKDGRL